LREIFVPRNFKTKLARIEQANAILTEYAGQGFTLTLRQLFYQFVARQLVENTQANYDALGNEFEAHWRKPRLPRQRRGTGKRLAPSCANFWRIICVSKGF
jgi:hypothetical protein